MTITNETHVDPRCNLIHRLYNQSPYEEFQLKGYRDFYMKMGGYVQLLVNLGLTIQSTYESYDMNKTDQYVEVQKMYGSSIQKAIVSLIDYDHVG